MLLLILTLSRIRCETLKRIRVMEVSVLLVCLPTVPIRIDAPQVGEV